MIDVLTIQEIELSVQAQAAELEAHFQRLYTAPLIRAQLVQDVLEHPELAEGLKTERPQEYDLVMRQIKRMQAVAKAAVKHGQPV